MTDLAERVSEVAERYRHGHDRPLGPYSVLDALYGSVVVGIGVLARRRRLPELSVRDVALIGVATHRLARSPRIPSPARSACRSRATRA
jgi:hypothetical protein